MLVWSFPSLAQEKTGTKTLVWSFPSLAQEKTGTKTLVWSFPSLAQEKTGTSVLPKEVDGSHSKKLKHTPEIH